MDMSVALTSFITLFLVVDPIGMAPMFVAMTQGMSAARRRKIAYRACFIAFLILTVFGLLGRSVLDGMNISLPAFRIAGGMLLFLIAVEMLFERRTQRREGMTEDEDHDPSVFPLATPLIAGPGAMATMILLNTGTATDWTDKLIINLVMAAVIGVVLVLFLFAPLIERILGRNGIMVVTRLLGMLLAALSVQFVLDGLTSLGVLSGAA